MFSRHPISTALLAICFAAVAVQAAQAADPDKKTHTVYQAYQVADLVMSPDLVNPNSGEPAQKKGQVATDEDRLIKLITETIEPASWRQGGGNGSIYYFAPTMSLVVEQTPDIQEQIAGLLASLRALAQDPLVRFEVRFVTVSHDFAERIAKDFGLKSGPDHRVSFLSAKQFYKLMETVSDDRSSNVTTAPRLTAQNRQAISLKINLGPKEWKTVEPWSAKLVADVGEQGNPTDTGWHVTVLPVVSADRRFVKLSLNVEQKEASTTYLPKTVTVPDGGTVLLRGFRTTDNGHETRRAFVLVTPHIVVQQEEEKKVGQQGNPSPKALAELLRAYDAACDQGRPEDADKLARAALILDPTCFRGKR